MSGAYDDQAGASGLGRLDPCLRILEDKAVFDRLPQPFRSEQEAVRRRLPILDILAGNQNRRCAKAGGLKTNNRQLSWRGCNDSPSACGQGIEKIFGTRYRFDASYVSDFGEREKSHLFCRVDICQAKSCDSFDCLSSVDRCQQGVDLNAVPQSPLRPNPFCYSNRIKNGSVHIE